MRALTNIVAFLAAQQFRVERPSFDFKGVGVELHRRLARFSLTRFTKTNRLFSPPSLSAHPVYWRRTGRFLSSWTGSIRLTHAAGKTLQVPSSRTLRPLSMRGSTEVRP